MARFDLDWIQKRLDDHQLRDLAPKVTPRRAAVAIILRWRTATDGPDPRWDILFIRRTVHDGDPWSGHMAFPGGRMDQEDPSPRDTAVRETREEVGLDLEQDARCLGRLDDVWASARGQVLPLTISPYIFLLERDTEIICDREEVELAFWAPLSQLRDPGCATIVHYELKGQHFDLPGISVSGQTIWGLTYQMLMSLFQVLEWTGDD